jgi:predicted ATPase
MITQYKVKNFKSLKAAQFDFKNLNLLTGLNGMGKSSLIQSLLLLRQSFQKDILLKYGLYLRGEIIDLGFGKDVFYESAGVDDLLEISIKCDQFESTDFQFSYSTAEILPNRNSIKSGDAIFDCTLFTNDFQYLNADRKAPNSLHERSDFDVVNKNQIGNKGEYAIHYLAEYGTKYKVSHPKLIHPKRREGTDTLIYDVEAWLSEISPGTRLKINPISDKIEFGFEFEKSVGTTNEHKPVNVGFGLSYVLPIIVAALTAKEGKTIIIENPESHIHPRGQSKLGELLFASSQTGAQLFIETHSDHILNGIRVAINKHQSGAEGVGIFFFKMMSEGDEKATNSERYTEVLNPIIDNDGRIDNWPDDFFDEWEKNIMQLI